MVEKTDLAKLRNVLLSVGCRAFGGAKDSLVLECFLRGRIRDVVPVVGFNRADRSLGDETALLVEHTGLLRTSIPAETMQMI